jgi:UDPglucose 6-dehydrogenase
MEINRDMRRLVLQKVRGTLGSVEEKTIGVLGLAFKPNTDDLRESPAIEIIHLLQSEGAKVKAFDPAANEAARTLLPGVELCNDAYEVAEGADAVILMTHWSEFRRLDLERVRRSMKYPLLVDGRNLYDPAEMLLRGFIYQPIGRPVPETSAGDTAAKAELAPVAPPA